ncbi:serine protease inhibitor 3/4-like [Microplitis mediator]|uniref:serine protease inhibitor 3/4-like n=1 Tax=Microplitis mediator TaxID=375433 RepID=UPI002554C353|nr:serine protease inhibitor 3/4-like [Microplitis mediator]
MKVFIFLIILIVSIIQSSNSESEECEWEICCCEWITDCDDNGENTTTVSLTDDEKMQAIRMISSSIRNFTLDLQRTRRKTCIPKFITSPLSAAMVLMMAAYGATDENAKKMNSMLYFDTNDRMYKTGIYSLINMVNALNPSEFELANKIYAGKNQNINPDFKSLVSESFELSIENVDFGLSENTAKKIDNWRADKSHQRITNVIKPDEISADTEFLFTNSFHFSAVWKEPFNEANTKLMKFNTSDGKTIEKPIMYRDMAVANITPGGQKVYVLELQKMDSNDYKYEVLLFCPPHIHHDEFKNSVAVPKFRIEITMNLADMLNQSETYFSGISKQSSGLRMNKVDQKFTLEINELGIEAAVYSEASFTSKTEYSAPPSKQDPILNEYAIGIVISYADTDILSAHFAGY